MSLKKWAKGPGNYAWEEHKAARKERNRKGRKSRNRRTKGGGRQMS